jgi:hypothetical protein
VVVQLPQPRIARFVASYGICRRFIAWLKNVVLQLSKQPRKAQDLVFLHIIGQFIFVDLTQEIHYLEGSGFEWLRDRVRRSLSVHFFNCIERCWTLCALTVESLLNPCSGGSTKTMRATRGNNRVIRAIKPSEGTPASMLSCVTGSWGFVLGHLGSVVAIIFGEGHPPPQGPTMHRPMPLSVGTLLKQHV